MKTMALAPLRGAALLGRLPGVIVPQRRDSTPGPFGGLRACGCESLNPSGSFNRWFARIAFFVVFLPALARADFRWTSTTAYASAEPSEGRATAQFTFKNTGADPIRILGARTTCGCTAAVADSHPIPPGGTGKIDVTFKTLNRRGLYGEPIVVDTDDPTDRQDTVTLYVMIRNPVELLPTLLFWQPGEPLTSKVIRITVADGFDVKSMTAICADPAIDIHLSVIKLGTEYKVTVTPKSPNVKTVVSITAEIVGKPTRVLTAHIRVS